MGKQPAVSVSASHFISLKLSYSSSNNSSPLREARPVSVGMGAPCGDPHGHGHTHSAGPRQHTGRSPWLSLLPCRPAGTSLFRMYQDSGDPLSCCHFRIGHPWLPTLGSPPRVESWSLCPRLSLLLFSLLSHPNAALLPLLHLTSKPPTRDNVWVGQSP